MILEVLKYEKCVSLNLQKMITELPNYTKRKNWVERKDESRKEYYNKNFENDMKHILHEVKYNIKYNINNYTKCWRINRLIKKPTIRLH